MTLLIDAMSITSARANPEISKYEKLQILAHQVPKVRKSTSNTEMSVRVYSVARGYEGQAHTYTNMDTDANIDTSTHRQT